MNAERRSGFYDEAAETMSLDARRAMQDGFLGPLVAYACEKSALYRAKLDGAGLAPGDVATLENLARVPVTRKRETEDMGFEGIQAVPYNQARRIFVSPGPQFYAYGPVPQEANPLLRVYHAIGFRPGDIVLNTFSYHWTPAGVNFDDSLGAFGCAVIPAGPGQTELQVQTLSKLDVTGYVGTPSFLKIIAARARELGHDPASFGLEVALTSAEPLPDELRAELQDAYGATVRQLYGSADGLLPCYECWVADGMHVPDLMILEIVDPSSGEPLPAGEPGAVCATVFNPYRPLLRFLNGDRAVLLEGDCPCGRTAPRIRFAGRIEDGVKVRGMFVYAHQVAEVMERFGVERWRAVVEHDAGGLDVFRVELDGAEPGGLREALRAAVRVRADVLGGRPVNDTDVATLRDERTKDEP
ncbi:MAG TPA: AMP-binding protein [Actinomycetota bacterium]